MKDAIKRSEQTANTLFFGILLHGGVVANHCGFFKIPRTLWYPDRDSAGGHSANDVYCATILRFAGRQARLQTLPLIIFFFCCAQLCDVFI